MNKIVHDYIENYLDALAPRRDAPIKRMEEEAYEEGIPIVGPHVGSLLYTLARSTKAKSVLELGSAIGYSTLWLARGLMGPRAKVVTIEREHDFAERARLNLKAAKVLDRVDVLTGEALEILPKLQGQFDLVFNDIDKEDYPEVLPHCKRLMKKDGLLVTDNVLWGGLVATKDQSAATRAIREYNEMITNDEDLVTVILPIRDGLSISIKVAD